MGREGLSNAIKQCKDVEYYYDTRIREYFEYLKEYDAKLRLVERVIQTRGLDRQAFRTERDLKARYNEARMDLHHLKNELRASQSFDFAHVEAVNQQARHMGVLPSNDYDGQPPRPRDVGIL